MKKNIVGGIAAGVCGVFLYMLFNIYQIQEHPLYGYGSYRFFVPSSGTSPSSVSPTSPTTQPQAPTPPSGPSSNIGPQQSPPLIGGQGGTMQVPGGSNVLPRQGMGGNVGNSLNVSQNFSVVKGDAKVTRATPVNVGYSLNGNGMLYIPQNTLVASQKNWNGVINPPTVVTHKVLSQRNMFLIRGSSQTPLFFNKKVTYSIPVQYGEGKYDVYYTLDNVRWRKLITVSSTNGSIVFGSNVSTHFLVRWVGGK